MNSRVSRWLGLSAAFVLTLALTGPARAEKIEDPSLKDAKVGDWIELRVVMPAELKMSSTTKQTITAVTKDEVTIEAENVTKMNGKELPSTKVPPQKRARFIEKTEADKAPTAVAAGGAKQTTEKIKAADGKDYECLVIEAQVQGKSAKTYLCKDLPLGGLVKTEIDGKITMEMVGWGRGK